MSKLLCRSGLWMCSVVLTFSCVSAASALAPAVQTFSIFQDGYADGAVITGHFAGSDLDGNGILVHFPDLGGGPTPSIEHLELTAFAAQFSGNSLSPAFDVSLDDLFGLVFQLGTDWLGDDPAFDPTVGNIQEGVAALGTANFYTSGIGPNGFIGGLIGGAISGPGGPGGFEENALDSTPNLVRVRLVPEPAGVAMVTIGIMVVASCRTRRARTPFPR